MQPIGRFPQRPGLALRLRVMTRGACFDCRAFGSTRLRMGRAPRLELFRDVHGARVHRLRVSGAGGREVSVSAAAPTLGAARKRQHGDFAEATAGMLRMIPQHFLSTP
jgi:hypothetical protein